MHFHLFAAIAWIGGAIFMFVLGITLKDKKKQDSVYPHVGPIFGYYQFIALILLLSTGIIMSNNNGLLDLLIQGDKSDVVYYLGIKLWAVLFVIIATFVHFYIAMKTNNKQRSYFENILSRGSSLFIFFANLYILHYAIMIRSIL